MKKRKNKQTNIVSYSFWQLENNEKATSIHGKKRKKGKQLKNHCHFISITKSAGSKPAQSLDLGHDWVELFRTLSQEVGDYIMLEGRNLSAKQKKKSHPRWFSLRCS